MNDSNPNDVTRHRASVVDRVRELVTGRRWLVPAAVAVLVAAGLALIGGQAMLDDPKETAASTVDAKARADAAERADRAVRPSAAAPTATPAPAKPKPSPTKATQKPTPKPTQKATTTAPKPKATTTAPKPKAAWVTPMSGAEITSCFGMRWGVLHAGIDLAMPEGTPIRAAGAGMVVSAGWAYSGYGISVVVDHGNGYLTHYAHMNGDIVSVGQRVAVGQTLGYEGSTGDSTGPHLHFEVHNGLWNQIDPAPWMRSRGVNLGC